MSGRPQAERMTEAAPAARPAPDSRSAPRLRLGLGEAEASARLKSEGFNELPRPEDRSPLRIVLEVLREPMLALLLAGGAIYLLLGDLREALILVVFAALSVIITVVQEARTERVLDALRDLTSPRALVIRDGKGHGRRRRLGACRTRRAQVAASPVAALLTGLGSPLEVSSCHERLDRDQGFRWRAQEDSRKRQPIQSETER